MKYKIGKSYEITKNGENTVICGDCYNNLSDKDLIKIKIDSFLNAYNSGDMEKVFDCMDKKSKNKYKYALKIGNGLIGKTGFGIDIADVFGLAINSMSDDDVLTLSNVKIEMKSKTKARVDVILSYKDTMHKEKSKAFFTMVKEDGEWGIKDLEPVTK